MKISKKIGLFYMMNLLYSAILFHFLYQKDSVYIYLFSEISNFLLITIFLTTSRIINEKKSPYLSTLPLLMLRVLLLFIIGFFRQESEFTITMYIIITGLTSLPSHLVTCLWVWGWKKCHEN